MFDLQVDRGGNNLWAETQQATSTNFICNTIGNVLALSVTGITYIAAMLPGGKDTRDKARIVAPRDQSSFEVTMSFVLVPTGFSAPLAGEAGPLHRRKSCATCTGTPRIAGARCSCESLVRGARSASGQDLRSPSSLQRALRRS